MSSPLPLPSLAESCEPIPGYRLIERIGRGGSGDVWRAEAPGGLFKAVKLVRGQDSRSAEIEYKALQRIKQFPHPFLLSVERIEIVDDTLVVVTELAEGSLREQFEEYRKQGLPGIPRDLLLRHLTDAADALDFICTRHDLQHLDVKPENLLLVGGRVKIGDFGLVRNVEVARTSIIGGLTPCYAAPELFDGRPHRNSDQYSLAVLYQEMLTGQPPFVGRTTAQLAALHLHAKPRLDGLPSFDRPVMAKALAKDPANRHASSSVLMAALTAAGSSRQNNAPPTTTQADKGASTTASRPVTNGIGSAAAVNNRTLPLGEVQLAMQAAARTEQPSVPVSDVVTLPPLELDAEPLPLRPTLFIGVGRLGRVVLQALRRRLADRFGNLDDIPSWRLLLIDTDIRDANEATRGVGNAALPAQDILAIPLKPAADYRASANRLSTTISRRWLYNIPRSLQTEGFRPLGYLALTDHAETVERQLSSILAQITDARAVADSQRQAGLSFTHEQPAVTIVAGTAGGTGSSIAGNLGYLVRKLLAEAGQSDSHLRGILVHATDRRARTRDLAKANTYACIAELAHFSQPGSKFPGDPGCKLPTFDGEAAPFNCTYVVDLGDDLADDEFLRGGADIAEYLYRDVATPASAFFDADRLASQQGGGEPTVRSFGICRIGVAGSEIPGRVARHLCRQTIALWRGENVPDRKATSFTENNSAVAQKRQGESMLVEEIDRHARVEAEKLHVNLTSIEQELYRHADEELGTDTASYFRSILAGLANQPKTTPSAASTTLLQQVLASISEVLEAESNSAEESGEAMNLLSALCPHVRQLAQQHSTSIGSSCDQLLDASGVRLKGAMAAAEWFSGHLQELVRELAAHVTEYKAQVACAQAYFAEPKNHEAIDRHLRETIRLGRQKTDIDERLVQFFQLKIHGVILQSTRRVLNLVLADSTALLDRFRGLRRDLEQLGSAFADGAEANSAELNAPNTSPLAGRVQAALTELLAREQGALVRALDAELARSVLAQAGGLQSAVAGTYEARSRFTADMLVVARHVLQEFLTDFEIGAETIKGLDATGQALVECLSAAEPKALASGGARRLLLAGSAKAQPQDLIAALTAIGQPPTFVQDSDPDLLLCYEASQIPLADLAQRLTADRPEIRQLGERLHTRTDIAWLPL